MSRSKLIKNEQKCIDFVLRRLESRFSQERTDVCCPEDNPDTPTNMRTDAVATIGDEKFVIEHTMIEPYEGYHKQGFVSGEANVDLNNHLENLSLSVGIDVALPSDWGNGFSKKKRGEFIESLANLLRKKNAKLENLNNDDIFVSLGEMDGIRIKVARNDFETFDPPDTSPSLILIAPENYSHLRGARIERSLKDKLPKLSEWKQSHQTVLILENQDISLTSGRSVRSEIEGIWAKEGVPPIDYLYLVSTPINPWRMYPFVEKGNWVLREPNQKLQVEKIDSNDLSFLF